MRTAALVVALVVLCPLAAVAQETAPAPSGPRLALDIYHERALQVRYSWWTGLRVYRGEDDAGVGLFGGDAEEVFAGSEDALEAMEQCRAMRISGFVLYILGVVGLVAELGVLLGDIFEGWEILMGRDGQPTPVFWAWTVGATGVSVAGGVLMSLSFARLVDAVNIYNDDLYRSLREQATGTGARPVVLSFRGTF